jgi:uncharacterized membrane protein YhaH (DUF805 family)
MDQFVASYKAAMARFNQFSGRTGVGSFWRFAGVNIVILFVLALLGVVSSLFLIAYLVYSLVVIIPSIAIAIRRLHDTDRSGWFLLLGLIPLAGLVILLLFYIQPSGPPNQYGEGPAPDTESAPAAW